MKKYTLLFIAFINISIFAQTPDDYFKKGNTFYKQGDYQKAIEMYEKALQGNEHSAELYYNLGNAYYKLNKIAPSIYYYEKAKKLLPSDEDIKKNLGLAKRMKLDKIEEVPQSFTKKFQKSIALLFNFNTWAVMTVIWTFIGLLAFGIFLFSKNSNTKRVGFAWMFISLFMLLFSWYFAGISQKISQQKYAIIFVPETSLMTEPNFTSEKVVDLHEGTKVKVIREDDDWFYVQLPDGKKAWLPKADVKIY